MKSLPQIIYDAYPDADLLPIDPPKASESAKDFARRARRARDTLFEFIAIEASEAESIPDFMRMLGTAVNDLSCVIRDAARELASNEEDRIRADG